MQESSPKPANENMPHQDGVVELRIRYRDESRRSRVTETGEDEIEPEAFADGEAIYDPSIENEDHVYDVDSPEGLERAREYIRELAAELVEWQASPGEISPDAKVASDHIRTQLAHCVDLIRYQNEALATGAGDGELKKRAEKISEAINTLSNDYENFAIVLGDESGFMLRELADDIRSRSAVLEEPKTGWWNKNFQEAQGVNTKDTDGEVKQVWGESDQPIGFEPPVTEEDQDTERVGWWDANFKDVQGFPQSEQHSEYTQRGELVSQSVAEEATAAASKHFVAYPLPGGKKRVFVSHQNPEDLFPTRDTALTPEKIEEYREWVEPSAKEDANIVEHVATSDVEVLPADVDPVFARTRQEWLEAKALHETKHREYHHAADAYYKSLNEQAFFAKNLTRLKASFGFKPQLPPEIEAMRAEMFAATEAYNAVARLALERRERGGKKPPNSETLKRYHQLLARTTLLNTFNAQQDLQKEAAENLTFKGSGILTKHGRSLRFAGAALIGGLTGGVAGGVFALTRTLASGAVAGVATGAVGEWQDRRVQKISAEAAEKYAVEIDSIEVMLKRGGMTKEDLEESYAYLSDIYYKVDRATQVRIGALLATAVLSGLAVGGAMNAFGEEVLGAASDGSGSREAIRAEAEAKLSEGAESNREAIIAGAEAKIEEGPMETSSVQENGSGRGVEAAEKTAGYTVEKGDNLWDILEGQTNAGKFSALEGLSEADKQEAIARVAEKFNDSQELREKFGMGKTAAMLYAGETVDTTALNDMLLEEIKVEDNGAKVAVSTETTPVHTDASAGGVSEVGNTETAASVTKKTSETLKLTSVSPDKIIEHAYRYEGGYMKFESDFQKQFVDQIQGKKSLGFFNLSGANTIDGYNFFASRPIAYFQELATLDEATLARELAQSKVEMKDYVAWRDALAQWQKAGMVIHPQDRFSYVAEAAFINFPIQTKAS